MTEPPPPRPSLRERVAARQRGESDPQTARRDAKTQRRWRTLAFTLQAVGLTLLLAYAWLLFERGFQNLNIWAVIAPSLLFVAGRAIHLWLHMSRRR
ncbi:MAG: hypothetical protein ACOY99_11265 [Pseudomonadota bacterium]|jgi:hypothetical protein